MRMSGGKAIIKKQRQKCQDQSTSRRRGCRGHSIYWRKKYNNKKYFFSPFHGHSISLDLNCGVGTFFNATGGAQHPLERWCECPHKSEDWCRRASLWTRATRRVRTKSSELFCSAFAIKLMHFLYAIRQFSFPLLLFLTLRSFALFFSFSGFNTSYKENYIRWYFPPRSSRFVIFMTYSESMRAEHSIKMKKS